MEVVNVFCLHGFLGQAQDWEFLKSHSQTLYPQKHLRFFCPDLFKITSDLTPKIDLEDWGRIFNQWVQEKVSDSDENILVGYSLGGRLALHALLHDDLLFTKAHLLSAHPGLLSPTEKEERYQRDLGWATDFRTKAWEEVLTKWNSQEVFKSDDHSLKRKEPDYDRELLSLAFSNWSLAKHNLSMQQIKGIETPLNWYCGERDKKFCSLYEDLRCLGAPGDFQVIANCGHRLYQQVIEIL